MARENQGLQIALIICVILTIVLIATTIFGWKGYQEEFIRANEADKGKSEAQSAATTAQTEANELKGMMGFQDADTLDVITAEKDNDMLKYAGTIDKSSQVYREVVKQLRTQLDKVSADHTSTLAAVRKLEERNEGLEKAKEQQIQAATKRADAAEADLAAERTANNASRAQLQQQNQDLQAQKAEIQKAGDDKLAKAQEQLNDANRRLSLLNQLLNDRNKKLDDILKPTFEVADGKVQWVNQGERIVWVNLGQADALANQTSFSVYPSDTSDVTDAGSKASIEIVQVHGAHLAAGRIVDDKITDPIMPGDLIHTPVWAPGQRQHFAICDGIDIDGDEKSDVDMIRNVIAMNGGVVDFWLTDDGQSHGEMTTNTRYLVRGTDPGVNDPERLRAHSEAIARAGELGIRSMPVLELLARMGWQNQSKVIKYGVGAKASDFKPKPPEGVPPVSSGTVSPLFKDRKPPRSSGKSAY